MDGITLKPKSERTDSRQYWIKRGSETLGLVRIYHAGKIAVTPRDLHGVRSPGLLVTEEMMLDDVDGITEAMRVAVQQWREEEAAASVRQEG